MPGPSIYIDKDFPPAQEQRYKECVSVVRVVPGVWVVVACEDVTPLPPCD